MKSIVTRYLGPTTHKGSRIKAITNNNKTLIIPYDWRISSNDNHLAAVESLRGVVSWEGNMECKHTARGIVCNFTESTK
jgi:hypothetical protein